MASSCAQLCLRCRSLLSSKTSTLTWQQSTQIRHCTAVSRVPNKILNGSSFISGNHTTTRARQIWKQQTCYYSDFSTKHLETEAKEYKHTEELLRTDVVPYKSPLLPIRDAAPVTENQMSLDLDAAAEFSALEEISNEEAVALSVPTALPPASTSLRDYVDKSETLTKLVQLGVNLWKLEQRPNVGSMLLRLNFNTDVAPRLLFLKGIGVEDSRLGYIISHNPFILIENLENLQARVNYLKSKKFSSETVVSMVSRAPYLLNFSVKRLDNRLGFYQQQLNLSASSTRNIIARLPRLLCSSLEPVKENLKVPHHLIVKFPQVLNTRYLRVKERHLFLQYLGKDQYDPTQPNYISLDRLVSLPDETFCTELALATMEDFCLFQKTL
ncbi:transcription termination factor 3%2C mitochondrial [Scomber scombrus]|uniref:Transcription termination factor 3, mitochondrial n=1 Tax=Scomber scombrus TaxID=13677 RepID=A0AAV1MRF2_SCOSC